LVIVAVRVATAGTRSITVHKDGKSASSLPDKATGSNIHTVKSRSLAHVSRQTYPLSTVRAVRQRDSPVLEDRSTGSVALAAVSVALRMVIARLDARRTTAHASRTASIASSSFQEPLAHDTHHSLSLTRFTCHV
jgi:hypothetical protein